MLDIEHLFETALVKASKRKPRKKGGKKRDQKSERLRLPAPKSGRPSLFTRFVRAFGEGEGAGGSDPAVITFRKNVGAAESTEHQSNLLRKFNPLLGRGDERGKLLLHLELLPHDLALEGGPEQLEPPDRPSALQRVRICAPHYSARI